MPEDWREKKLHKKKAILIKIYKEMARIRKELCAIRSLLEENKADAHLKESGQEKAAVNFLNKESGILEKLALKVLPNAPILLMF